MRKVMGEISVLLSYPQEMVRLAMRWVLAYGFAKPALLKYEDLNATAAWFLELHIPLAHFTAYLVTGIELLGIAALIFGFLTRFFACLLSLVMVGAIFFVHGSHGFSVADNGIEIPLYYLLFLLFLATYGAGKYALDHLLFKENSYE